MEKYQGFEQGPIRPPSEAYSLLLRLTRNCPWNRCTFCSVYKRERFSLRPVPEILRDIDTVYRFVNELQDRHGSSAACGRRPLSESLSAVEEQAFWAAKNWLEEGMQSIFLQDADSLVMPPGDLVAVLRHVKMRFPSVARITSYARSTTVARISDEDLAEIAAAGLNRIHIGLETASDRLLKMTRKGVTKAIHIQAGRKTRRAGIELSEYVLTGIGGRQFWQEHARETADALNQINPDFIRLRTLHFPAHRQLYADDACRWGWPPDLLQAREILLLIEKLENITSRIKSDHMYNLLQEVDGVLPQDKEALLSILREFIQMDPGRRTLFQVGKRLGHFWRLSDMQIPGRMAQVEAACQKLDITPENVDDKIGQMLQESMARGM